MKKSGRWALKMRVKVTESNTDLNKLNLVMLVWV